MLSIASEKVHDELFLHLIPICWGDKSLEQNEELKSEPSIALKKTEIFKVKKKKVELIKSFF